MLRTDHKIPGVFQRSSKIIFPASTLSLIFCHGQNNKNQANSRNYRLNKQSIRNKNRQVSQPSQG